MKTIKYLLVAIFFLLFANMASAVPMWFDADGSGNTYDAIYMDTLNGSMDGWYDTNQYLGSDGELGNGDAFDHDSPLNLVFASAELDESGVQGYEDIPPADLYAQLRNIGGTITDYNSGPDSEPTSLTNPGGIEDDAYRLSYTPGMGEIEFYYDPDDDLDPSDAYSIGTFEITQGGGDVVDGGSNSTLTSDIGFDLIATNINPGYFFLDDNGSQGMDVSTWLNESDDNFFFSIADGSINLRSVTPDVDNNALVLESGDNGYDVEFGPVPEPATMILFGIGLLGLSAVSRKKFIN